MHRTHNPIPITNSDSSGFSTIFGDLVFGLLFVFFLLAIALVFNKPEEGAFASEVTSLKTSLNEEAKNLKKLKAYHKQLRVRLAKVQERVRKRTQNIDLLEKQKQNLESGIARRVQEYEKRLEKTKATIERNRKKNDVLTTRISEMLASQAKDGKMLQRELARQRNVESAMRKSIGQLKKRNQQLDKDIQRGKRVTAELDAIVGTLKGLLNQGGYPEILAEVKAAEKEVNEEREKRRNGSKEDESLKLKLMADYQPDSELFQVKVLQGKSVVERVSDLRIEQLVALCERVMKAYDEMSSEYSKEEKKKYRPRLVLKTPSSTPYKEVEEILKKLKKIIPVTITV